MKTKLAIVIILFAIFFGTGCATVPRYYANQPMNGVYQVSDDFAENAAQSGKVSLYEVGIASYYADKYHGNKTANGEIFDKNVISAAHQKLPFDSMVKVTNIYNDKSVLVRINDRGPFKDGRIIDLSEAAAKEIDMILTGTAPVRLEVME